VIDDFRLTLLLGRPPIPADEWRPVQLNLMGDGGAGDGEGGGPWQQGLVLAGLQYLVPLDPCHLRL
jgi:hypothetical protein